MKSRDTSPPLRPDALKGHAFRAQRQTCAILIGLKLQTVMGHDLPDAQLESQL